MPDVFFEISAITIIAVLAAMLMRSLRQPLIIGHILTGIIIGSFGLMSAPEAIEGFAHIGIALLLFMVGLNLDPRSVKEVGKASILGGLGQILFTVVIGFFICLALGMSIVVALYVALALTFSSTIIIMKMLSDKNDLETLYGRIAVGILIVQDLVAILVLITISSLQGEGSILIFAAQAFLKGTGLLAILTLLAVYVFPRITKSIAKNQELLLLFSTGWCFLIASLFHLLNFSIEAGALLAGITLSISPYRFEISAKMRPLRDFFIVMFFILLGAQMSFGNVSTIIVPTIVLSLFILIGNPLIVMIIMGYLGYTKRNSFLTGLTVAQISEFSLILIALGVSLGHLPQDILTLVTVVGVVTIAGSTYLILYGSQLYKLLRKYLTVFERSGKKVDEHAYHEGREFDIILFGYNRIGYNVLTSFRKIKKKFLIIDYNPDVIVDLAKQGFESKYGDVADAELLDDLNLAEMKMAVSTIPVVETNLLLIHKIRSVNTKAIIIVITHQIDDALSLYDAGASYVIMPHFLGGHHMSTMIEEYGLDTNKYLKEKIAHIEHITLRKDLGHEHPRHVTHK